MLPRWLWTRALPSLLAAAMIIAVSADSAGAARQPRDCSPGWVFCGGESLELDLNGEYWFPGAYVDSGQGTGRFGLVCAIEDTSHCFLYAAELRDGQWWSVWEQQTPDARHVYMHGSGNLQVFDSNWSLVWETGTTTGESDAYLNVHDNGCVAIWHEDDSAPFWSAC
jgi:hypothetical protein